METKNYLLTLVLCVVIYVALLDTSERVISYVVFNIQTFLLLFLNVHLLQLGFSVCQSKTEAQPLSIMTKDRR